MLKAKLAATGRMLTRILALVLCTMPGLALAGSAPPVWVTAPVNAPNVSQQVFVSQAVGAPVSYHVYLPDAYAEHPQRRFPVLYWLHGSDSVTAGIAQVSAIFDAAIAAGHIPPLILVFANGLPLGMWCDADSGLQPVESMVVDDLIPEVDHRFRTIPEARSRLVEGFSMGGYGAARYGLKYPDRFGATSILGAGPLQLDFLVEDPNLQPIELRRYVLAQVYGNSLAVFEAHSPWRLAEQQLLPPGYRLRQVVGTLDFTLGPNRDFHTHLDELGIGHDYVELPNVSHSPTGIINALGAEFWTFHRQALLDADRLLGDGFE
ncbi:MAG TPA: alpha/beta hydrolase-fold protein [Xanthomonadales bacterium]|nr:alpha/beta hydrolase-fold protein [Xanthomonadales bacterium]